MSADAVEFCSASSWGRLGRYINVCCNFRRRFFVSLAFSLKN
jgi:hypothetical protein